MTAESFAAHLQSLAEAMSIEAIVPDADGLIAIRLDAERTLNLVVEDEQITLFAPLGTLPTTGRENIYAHMLRANRFWRGTAGATLSLDDAEPPRAILALCLQRGACPPARFVETVERFADRMSDWSMALLAHADTGDRHDPAAATGYFPLA